MGMFIEFPQYLTGKGNRTAPAFIQRTCCTGRAYCIQLFQLRLSDPTQAYATRPKGSVGSCKSDLV